MLAQAAVVVGMVGCWAVTGAGGEVLHVSTGGDDAGPGTKARPLATPKGARDAIRALRKKKALPAGGVTVLLHGGGYVLDEPLVLTPADGGTADAPIVYAAVPGENVVLSGGRRIAGWRRAKGALWTATLPDVKAGRWHFRQLFGDSRRLTRARTPNEGHFLTVGPLSKFAERSKRRWGGYGGTRDLRREHPDAYCGFAFRPGDIREGPAWRDAEIITYHSWECSWQTIRRIDLARGEVHFNTPCRYPIGFFGKACRYRIENVPAAFDAPGEWYLDRRTGVLSYLARDGEDPSRMEFVAPVLEKLLVLEGKPGRPVEHVTFRGLSFRHAKYPMGIYDVAPDWPAPARKADPTWPRDFPPGYTDAQAAPLCGQAVELRDASRCAFENCEMTQLGASAIKLFARCTHNRIARCRLHDLGGSGVLIGLNVRRVERSKTPPGDAPAHNLVEDCTIEHVSLVHPSAVGVWIAQSHHNTVRRNLIADVGYAGIHVGWTWGRYPNYTAHNLIERNHIHHVMRELADAAGIYSLGPQAGTVYRENYIHDLRRAPGCVGAPVDGLFFDQGSQHIHVERNVIRRSDHAAYRFNQCRKEDMTWSDNDFDAGDSPVKRADVVRNAGPMAAGAVRAKTR